MARHRRDAVNDQITCELVGGMFDGRILKYTTRPVQITMPQPLPIDFTEEPFNFDQPAKFRRHLYLIRAGNEFCTKFLYDLESVTVGM